MANIDLSVPGETVVDPVAHRNKMRYLKIRAREKREANRKMSKQAWLQVRRERRAYREAELGWRQRIDYFLACTLHVEAQKKGAVDAAEWVRREAWQLFGVRFKP